MSPRTSAPAPDTPAAHREAAPHETGRYEAAGDKLACRAPTDLLEATRKAAVIAGLRSRILNLERHAPRRGPLTASQAVPPEAPCSARQQRWEFGCNALDALLPRGLATNVVHEIKGTPSATGGASAADWMMGIGFAARLAVRRTDALSSAQPMNRPSLNQLPLNQLPPNQPPPNQPWVLWCWPKAVAGEFGALSAAGFAHLGLDPARLIVVETARSGDALNAIEESLKGGSLAVVVGVLDELDLMPARRLSLAAGEMATPCLLVTHPASAPAGATATRWRIKRLPSAAHRFDPRASGTVRFEVTIERCRARPESTTEPPFVLEWSDETHRFNLASVMADLPAQTRRTGSGAGKATLRSC